MNLADTFGRRVTYLRVSLTDRCNYRCVYCMPEEGIATLSPKSDMLSFEEIARLVRCFVGLGVRRVRLTGGEPTVRRGFCDLVQMLAVIPGIDELCLTTNGHLLADLAVPLKKAGIHHINVSLDSLRPERFRAITRRGDLAAALAGIEAVCHAGFAQRKINAVGLRGINTDELGELCRFSWHREMIPRFIEWMPMGEGSCFDASVFISAAEMRAAIEREIGGRLTPLSSGQAGRGPARYFRHSTSGHEVGFISALTENFCDTCNRVRLTATGELHTCLARDESVNLRNALRSGATDLDIVTRIQAAVAAKQEGHAFTTAGCGGPRKAMVAIGG